MIKHPTYRCDEEDDDFDSTAAVSGHLVELEWRYTNDDLKEIARRERARLDLGGFGFRP